MKRNSLTLAAILTAAISGAASAAYYVPGGFQGWDPGSSSAMTNVGGNVYELSVNGLTANSVYEFKILNSAGTPSWSDPQVTPDNAWFVAGASGSATIRLTAGAVGDGYLPASDRVGFISNGWTPQVVGDFQSEAGGTDWTPSDPLFNMVNQGGGVYTYNAVVSTPGSYQYKSTNGAGWKYQLNSDGLRVDWNTGTQFFSTTDPNQTVLFTANAGSGYITASVLPVPEPTSLSLLGLGGLALIRRRK